MSEKREPPPTWKQRKATIKRKWTIPFERIEWACEWAAYRMSQWAFIEVLEYIGKLSLLGALLIWIWGIPARRQAIEDARLAKEDARLARLYAAWQMVGPATSQKNVSIAIDGAVRLSREGIRLDGLNLQGGFAPMPFALTNTSLREADFRATRFNRPNFAYSDMAGAKLDNTGWDFANLTGGKLVGATFTNAWLYGCDLSSNEMAFAALDNSQFTWCNFNGVSISAQTLAATNAVRFAGCNFANASFLIPRANFSPDQFVACNVYGMTDLEGGAFVRWATNEAGAFYEPITNQVDWLLWLEINNKLPIHVRRDFEKAGILSYKQFK